MKKFIFSFARGVLIMSLFLFAVTNNNTLSADTRILTARQSDQQIILSATQKRALDSGITKALPSVVTIEVIKTVPVMNVLYDSPFADDPILRDFGGNIPLYKLQGIAEQKVGAGSGFIFSQDGYIVTNKHVVNDNEATYTVVLADGTSLDANVVYVDENYDMAILKVDSTFENVAELGTSRKLMLGQPVAAIGNAYGEQNNTITRGAVAAFDKDITAQGDDMVENLSGLLESSTSIVPGFSGGPLIDAQGNVVGINVATDAHKSGSSFSIPIDDVKDILATYKN